MQRTLSVTGDIELVATYVEVFTLAVSSSPVAADFTINGVAARTPYTVELGSGTYVLVMPNVLPGNYVFRQWEDGSTNPARAINLAADSQVLAYYEYSPPPPGKGVIDVHARLDGVEVIAPVEITGVGTYSTPFTLEINPANYELKCTILKQTQAKTVTVASGQTMRVDFDFKTTPISPLPKVLPILAPILIGGVSLSLQRRG
jgi:hypothetical protein